MIIFHFLFCFRKFNLKLPADKLRHIIFLINEQIILLYTPFEAIAKMETDPPQFSTKDEEIQYWMDLAQQWYQRFVLNIFIKLILIHSSLRFYAMNNN